MAEKPTNGDSPRRFKRITRYCRQHWRMVSGLSVLGAFLLYLLVGFVGVPLVLRHVVLANANEKMVGTLEVKHFRFNPFTWELRIEEFKGLTRDGQEGASFAQLRVNLQPTTIFSDALVVREIFWDQPRLDLLVDEDGALNLSELFGSKNPSPKSESEPFVIPALVVEKFEVRDAGMTVCIGSLDDPFTREISNLSFVMKDLRSNSEHDNPYRFTLATGQGEQLVIEGAVRLDPLSSTGSIALENLKLVDFSTFGAGLTGVKFGGGSMTLGVDYQFRPLAMEPEFGISGGNITMRDVSLLKRGGEKPFQQLKLLQLSGLNFDVVEETLSADSLLLEGGSLELIREREGGFNVVRNFRSPNASTNSKTPAKPADPVTRNGKSIELGVVAGEKDMGAPIEAAISQLQSMLGKQWNIQLGELQINEHQLLWRDRSASPAVAIDFSELTLKAGPFHTDGSQAMNVDLRLQTGSAGKLELKGQLMPMKPLASTRVDLTVQKLPMASLSPYLVSVIGCPAKAGQLTAELDYTLEKGVIKGSNQLSIDDLQLGPRDQNSDAPNLPLGLAVALLEDSDGVMHIDIPVKGDLNEPKFSFGRMVSYAIGNVIGKLVESPFKALGGIFGGTDEAPDPFVGFKPGQAEPVKIGDKDMQALAKLLDTRPELSLKLTPIYAVKLDSPKLRKPAFENRVRALVDEGEDRKDAIEKLYQALPEKLQQAKGFFKHKEMEKIVRESVEVQGRDLARLGQQRALALKKIMSEQDGIEASRIQVADAEEGEKPGVRIGLGLVQN